jgi:outer membrane receptor protein involved in Fe transport
MTYCRPNKRLISVAVASAVAGAAPVAKAQLEEVIVTATKRAQSMQDVPVAVSAIREGDLDELRIGSFDDYVAFLPNVVSQGTGPGQNEIFIRGAATSQTVVTLSSVSGVQPSVALYLDEQPVALPGRNLDVFAADLARIEVLPGPQGTLFGASSQAGTVRLITNKPDFTGVYAGFDSSIAFTEGGDESNSVEAFLNLPISDKLAVRIVGYNENQGGWIDNKLNDPAGGGWNGSAVVVDRISGGPLPDPQNQTIPLPSNDAFVEDDFNDATYSGGRVSVNYLFNPDWDILVQHTQQSLDTDGVWAYDPNLGDEDEVNRFAPDNNEDEFGLTTWTVNGRMNMLDLIYTGGYLDRDINATIDYTWYTNGGLFAAYYVCYPGDGTYSECFDPSKFYKEDSSNTRMTHEFRVNTPEENRWRVTAGLFYDEVELESTGRFKIASTDSPYFQDLARTLAPGSTSGQNTNGGPFGPEISFVNDVTRTTEQVAVFGHGEFDITPDITASFGARWYEITDTYEGATTTVNVTDRLDALGDGSLGALTDFFGPAEGQAIFDAIQSGQLDADDLDNDGELQVDDVIIRASLDWHITNDIMVFGTYAQGFRPPVTNRVGGGAANNPTGAFENFRIPIYSKTDDLDNYELGIKGDFFGGTLRVNATAFYSEIDDLQTSRFDPTNVNFLWFIDNVGEAEITGMDADFTWAATDALTISGAFSILDTEITSLNPELEGIAVPEGSELPYAPEFSANLRARYDFELAEVGDMRGVRGYVTGSVIYTGESYAGLKMDAYVQEDTLQRVYQVGGSGLSIHREADVFEGAAPGTDLLNEDGVPGGRYEQDDYFILNAAVGFNVNSWNAELFVDNLADENAEVYIDTQQFSPRVVTNRPRTIGLRVGYRFE